MSKLGGLICIIIFLFLTIGLPIIIVHYTHPPKIPTFTLDNVSIKGFNLTSDGHFTSYFDVTIAANNNPKHKLKLDYSSVKFSIIKDNQNLANAPLVAFDQHKSNVTLLMAEPSAVSVSLDTGPKFDLGLESGMGYIVFDVSMTGKLNKEDLVVNCIHVIVNITNSVSSLVASSPSSTNVGNNFRSINCSVSIYSSPTPGV